MKLRTDKKISFSAYLKLQLVFVYLKGCNAILYLLEKTLYRNNKAPKHILVFRTGSLGDNICAIPSLIAIRKKYPVARIDILVNSGGANLVSLEQLLDHSCYDEIINYLDIPRNQLIKTLRARNYDLIIQLPQTGSTFKRLLRDILFFRSVAAGGFGWKLSTVPFFRQTQEMYIQFGNETSRLAILLEQYDIIVDQEKYALNITETDIQLAESEFRIQVQNENTCLGVVVGAKRAQNRWPVEYFDEVVQKFATRYNILLIGGPEDNKIVSQLQAGKNIYNFCGKLTPLQSAVLLKRCRLVLSNDTGPMHLAYAVATPVVAIFSSRDFPGKWFPPDKPWNKVNRTYGIHCSLCLSETCVNNICMKQIEPEVVINQIEELLQMLDRQAN